MVRTQITELVIAISLLVATTIVTIFLIVHPKAEAASPTGCEAAMQQAQVTSANFFSLATYLPTDDPTFWFWFEDLRGAMDRSIDEVQERCGGSD